MKQQLRKFIAPSLLIAAMVYPLSMTEAQRVSQQQKFAHGTNPSTPSRVNRATLPAAMIKSIRKAKGIKDAVVIKGNTITPRAGTSLWSLGDKAYVVMTNSDNVQAQAQAILKNLPGGAVHFYICMCNLRMGNDACQFSGGNDASHCGGQSCCSFHEGEIAADGTLTISS